MSEQSRFMLVTSPLMEHSPALDRAAALAKAEGAALHIVAFDYLEGLATASLVNEKALEQMRLGYVDRHRQWLEDQARPLRKIGVHVTTEVAQSADVGRGADPVAGRRLACRVDGAFAKAGRSGRASQLLNQPPRSRGAWR